MVPEITFSFLSPLLFHPFPLFVSSTWNCFLLKPKAQSPKPKAQSPSVKIHNLALQIVFAQSPRPKAQSSETTAPVRKGFSTPEVTVRIGSWVSGECFSSFSFSDLRKLFTHFVLIIFLLKLIFVFLVYLWMTVWDDMSSLEFDYTLLLLRCLKL